MSVETKILLIVQKITHAINSVQETVGDVAGLSTSIKTDLVSALNELKNDLINIINDSVTNTSSTWSSTKIDLEIQEAIDALIDGAPGSLDTLKELASALQNDPDIINALTNMANKRVAVDQVQSFTNTEKAQARSNIDSASILDLAAKEDAIPNGPSNTFLANDKTWKPVTKSTIGLDNVTNDTQLKLADLDTDILLSADSDTKIPSQRAIKNYVDNKNFDGGIY